MSDMTLDDPAEPDEPAVGSLPAPEVGPDLVDSDEVDLVGVVDHPATSMRAAAVAVEEDRWRRALGVGLVAYVVSRLCVLVGAGVRASQLTIDARRDGEQEIGAVRLITEVLTSWDGRWYLELVRNGYPDNIPANVTFDDLEARAAFFPMFPGAVSVLDSFLPGGDTLAALVLNFMLGAIGLVLVGLLARRMFSTAVAARSMVIFAFFPGSFVLSFAYSEALLIVFAASCLLLLLDEQWLLAGLAAALATATRPNGIAVVLACVVAAAIAIKTKRQWSALISVALAPLGFIGFMLYVDDTAGESRAWFRVQNEAWQEGTSFGATAVKNTFTFVTDPFESPAGALTALSIIALAGMCWCAWKKRLPLPWIAYCVVIIGLMLIPETVTARPRFVFTAFPLFIAVAAWWPDPETDPDHHRASWDRSGWDFLLVLCGAGLTGLTGLYAVFGAIP